MFSIYKYTFKKYLKSPSTWVIVALSVFIAGFLGGYLPYTQIATNKTNSATEYGISMMMIVSAITSFLAIFVSVFAGFKSATMFKDEVEDGTFLVILSKPISRNKIIFGKWLALQTAMLGYTFLTVLTYGLITLISDNGSKIEGLSRLGIHTITSQIFIVSMIIWGILMVVGFIFTSIALLLSTKLSVGATIGISIGIGVIIPVTSLVATFTVKPEFVTSTNGDPFAFENSFGQIKKGILEETHSKNTKNNELISSLDSLEKIYGTAFAKISKDKSGLLNLGVNVGGKDSFKYAWVADLNFQIQSLAGFASNKMVPEALRPILQSSSTSKAPMMSTKTTKRINGGDKWTAASLSQEIKEEVDALHKVEDDFNKPINVNPLLFINYVLNQKIWKEHNIKGKLQQYTWDQIINEDKFKVTANTADNGLPLTPIEKLIKSIHSMSSKPLTFIFNKKELDKAIGDYKKKSTSIKEPALKFSKVFNGYAWYKETNPKLRNETLIYDELIISAEHDKDMFRQVKTIEYVSKYTVLWAYLIISLILVPTSFLIIRKQDFR